MAGIGIQAQVRARYRTGRPRSRSWLCCPPQGLVAGALENSVQIVAQTDTSDVRTKNLFEMLESQ